MPSTVRDWTCPFCPLLCDDLTLTVEADGKLSAAGGCTRLAHALGTYGASDAQCPASIDGAPADFDAALAHAARTLGAARRPLIGGLATDVAGARALYALAAACGATLDHLHGHTMSAVTRVMQDRGAFFTTLSEIRTRADLIVFVGCRPSERYPRFYTRALGNAGFTRELVFLGCDVDPAAQSLPQVLTENLLPQLDLFDTVALWSALADGRRPTALSTLPTATAPTTPPADSTLPTTPALPSQPTTPTMRAEGGAAVDVLASLAARVAAARYAVIVYEPAALPPGQPALLIEGLHRIVKAVNRATRAACLALGGDDGALTVNQAVTWLSGLPLPLRVPSLASGEDTALPEHDAHLYRTARLCAEGGVDTLVWVASLGATRWPDALAADVPAIVIGHPALAAQAAARGAPTVFLPAASPGIDTNGHLFRLDGTVVAPLSPARQSPLVSVAAIATRLATQLAQKTATQFTPQPAGQARADRPGNTRP